VRTVYGFGYRFVGEVSVDTAAARPHSHVTPWLVLVMDSHEYPLIEGANVIGREPGTAIRIDSPGVSRHHARIVVAQGEATIDDLGSKNGTQLNGTRLKGPARLLDGDQIGLGAIRLTFRSESRTSPTETVYPQGVGPASE
jgi:pSer/pThr/pTyr-binding forkhead associated (FHA) protein